MRWVEAVNHAKRLADEGLDTTLHVDRQPDASVGRTATVRVTHASLPPREDLAGFFRDVLGDGLEIRSLDIDATTYVELS